MVDTSGAVGNGGVFHVCGLDGDTRSSNCDNQILELHLFCVVEIDLYYSTR